MEWKNHLKILTFKNCEFLCCHLDGYKEQHDLFMAALKETEKYFTGKSQSSTYRIWYNLDETMLNNALIGEVAKSIISIKSHVVKIAFIGVGRVQRWRLSKILKGKTGEALFPFAYFSDAEKAKEWLL